MAGKEKGSGAWSAGKILGLALVIIGIAVGIYFVYLWSTAGSRIGTFTRRGIGTTGAFNSTGFNQSGFNYTGTSRFRGGALALNQYVEGIIIGVLAILLGIMTFKYAGLKTATISKR